MTDAKIRMPKTSHTISKLSNPKKEKKVDQNKKNALKPVKAK